MPDFSGVAQVQGQMMLRTNPMKALLVGLFTGLLMVAVGFAAINLTDQEKLRPVDSAVSVAEKFYEYISEAKIRGGTMLINEAYKLTDGAQSRTNRALFLEVVNRYPSGFKVDIIDSTVGEDHAVVMIEYQLSSSFGGIITMRDPVHLNVDAESNTWKIDFRGDTDDQSHEDIIKIIQAETGTAGLVEKDPVGDNQ